MIVDELSMIKGMIINELSITSELTPELCKINNLIKLVRHLDYDDDDWEIPVEEFENSCKLGCFTDNDGYGYYADDEYEYKILVSIENAIKGKSNKNFKYVIWHNK